MELPELNERMWWKENRRNRRSKRGNEINLQDSCWGQGGHAEERAGGEEEDGGGGDDDGGGGDDGESCDILPGLIQKARLFPSSFHSDTQRW